MILEMFKKSPAHDDAHAHKEEEPTRPARTLPGDAATLLRPRRDLLVREVIDMKLAHVAERSLHEEHDDARGGREDARDLQ